MTGTDYDYIELFSELHMSSSFPCSARSLARSGFRRAARTPRKRLNLASGMTGADYDYIELFSELHTQPAL